MAGLQTSVATGPISRPAPAQLVWLERRSRRALLYLVLLTFGIIFAFPFYWVLSASVKDIVEIRAIP